MDSRFTSCFPKDGDPTSLGELRRRERHDGGPRGKVHPPSRGRLGEPTNLGYLMAFVIYHTYVRLEWNRVFSYIPLGMRK